MLSYLLLDYYGTETEVIKLDLSNLSDFDSLLLGFGVYILAVFINAVLASVISFAIPFLGVALAILMYFLLVRPNSGSALWYFVGFFALLIIVLVVAVVVVGGLLLFMFI